VRSERRRRKMHDMSRHLVYFIAAEAFALAVVWGAYGDDLRRCIVRRRKGA
jgi:hypothetical protein